MNFFQQCILRKCKWNHTHGIFKDGVWISKPSLVKEIFYTNIKDFLSDYGRTPLLTFGDITIPHISDDQKFFLKRAFSMEEIELEIQVTDPWKSPGPDGLNVRFIKSSWKWIKFDVLKMFDGSHKGSWSHKVLPPLL